MATLPTGLGKGLDGLIRSTQTTSELSGSVVLPVDDISPNPRQPRRSFDEAGLEELAASIRAQGLLQPVLVRPLGAESPGKYEIVAGERRWRACRIAGLTEIAAVVRSFTEQETLIAALIENLQREDLNPLEEARGLQVLKQEFDLSQEDIARKIGKSRSAIANSLRLLSLPESILSLLADGTLSPGHARALLGISDDNARECLKNFILERHLSVREVEGLVAGWKIDGRFSLADPDGTGEMSGPDDSSEEVTSGDEESTDDARTVASVAENPGVRARSAVLVNIQARISTLYKLPVRVTGKEEKGRISFTYNSREELGALLRRLCSRMSADGSGAALEGRKNVALVGGGARVLDGRDDPTLDGRDDPALGGRENPALDGRDDAALNGRDDDALDGLSVLALAGTDSPSPAAGTGEVAPAGTAAVPDSAGLSAVSPDSPNDSPAISGFQEDPEASHPAETDGRDTPEPGAFRSAWERSERQEGENAE
jgi:ParB family chromosome partitioning protein